MSRILRRPMFRGGKVIDSRGTGITSGLMDGGRVGYEKGNLVLGGDLYTKDDYTKFMTNYANTLPQNSALFKSIFETDDKGELSIKEDSKFSYDNMFGQATGKSESPQSVFTNVDSLLKPPGLTYTPGTNELGKNLKADIIADLKESKQFKSTEPRGGGADAAQYGIKDDNPGDPNNNNEQVTEVSAKDLIKENAELFKELLNEGQKEKIKEARIQDLSDLGLDIFAKSQQEGATVGSTLGGAAASLVGKDSRVDKAKAAIDKGNQTAVALAINDYIAGKRSKESTDQLIAKLKLSAELKEGSIGDQILAVAARQTLTGGKIKEILGVAVGDGKGKGIRTIPSGQENAYKPGPEDEGYFIFEEATKNVFKYEDGVLKPIYAPN